MDRERFEPLARYANPALWGTYGLDIVDRLVKEGKHGRAPELSVEDDHQLTLLEEFLDSARRGALPVSKMREERRRRVQELGAPKAFASRPSLSRDIESFKLVSDLLGAGVGSKTSGGASEAQVTSWVERVLLVLERLRTTRWKELESSERDFVLRELLPMLTRLAALTHEAEYVDSHRGPWHVIAV